VALGQIRRLAEVRVKRAGQRLGLRAALAAVAALAFVVFLFFGLAALAVWMMHSMRPESALLVIAGGALVVMLAILLALRLEARKHRRLAAQRQSFDQQLVRTAALAAMPSKMPSRPVAGLGLVAIGALLVVLGKRRNDD